MAPGKARQRYLKSRIYEIVWRSEMRESHPRQVLATIFDRFMAAHRHLTWGDHNKLRLGLYIAREIVAGHWRYNSLEKSEIAGPA